MSSTLTSSGAASHSRLLRLGLFFSPSDLGDGFEIGDAEVVGCQLYEPGPLKGAAMRLNLKTLVLDGRAVSFTSAWLDHRRDGFMTSWSGRVTGADAIGLMDVPEHELKAETTNGRQIEGRAIVPSMNRLAETFELQGTGALLVDGQEPIE